MLIKGLQKTTLLDYPGKVACTVFTGGCNFRCPFCHNAALVTHMNDSEVLDEEALFAYLSQRKNILDGVCITGGEPTLHPDLARVCDRIHSLGLAVKLDTNGSFPKRLEALIRDKQVDYIAMDIKNSKEAYARTCGLLEFPHGVEESIDLIRSSDIPYEFRTTVVREFHTAESLEALAKWIKGTKQYFLQAFTDSGDLIADGLSAYTEEEMQELLRVVQAHIPTARLRGI